jgi:hypothetical protein
MRNDHLNHKPDAEGIATCEDIRRVVIRLDELITAAVPKGREQSLALTKLEECRMWAIKGVVLQYPAQEV